MVKPAFLSRQHYGRQIRELATCTVHVIEITERIGNSLLSAHRLGLESSVTPLGMVWDELRAASENLDSAICYLQVLERTT